MKQLSEAQGRRIAIELLREIRRIGVDECVIDPAVRDGRAQSDVVGRYVRTIGEANPAAQNGFNEVLTHVVAMALAGCSGSDEPELLEKWYKHRSGGSRRLRLRRKNRRTP